MNRAIFSKSIIPAFVFTFAWSLPLWAPEVGADDFRITQIGADGNAAFEARDPDLALNTTDNEMLVVWSGDDTGADDELEIYGQLLNPTTGALIGSKFRISDMGPDGNANYKAFTPAVAYNSTNNEYLVIWRGDDDALGDNAPEIFGQRLDANGAEVGTNDFRISDAGATDNDTNFLAINPDVAYNSTNNEYLVVWRADLDATDDEFEIFGQRLNAATGAEVGTNDFRISDMGPNGNLNYAGDNPKVAYNSADNEYLVVWQGDDDSLGDGASEIWGQRLSGTDGSAVGVNDFRISDMGNVDNDTTFGASEPVVAYNASSGEYLVVWRGDDNTPGDNDFEIFGQRLIASTGAETGTNDFRISDMGTDGDSNIAGTDPDVAYDPVQNLYLVTWRGDDTADNHNEVYVQLLTSAGVETGTNDQRISDMGPDTVTEFYDAFDPRVAAIPSSEKFLVVFWGDDDRGTLADEEFEIYGQFFAAPGCGNGVAEAGEDCDDDGESATCNADCTTSTCGDGTLNGSAGEQCDDGNVVAGDGCDAVCQIEIPAGCGDGNIDSGEDCDDGNNTAGDGCAPDCVDEGATSCGDGVLQAGEECDDGNVASDDGCSGSCVVEGGAVVCGDGNIDTGEECDDGDTESGDGCSSDCANEVDPACGDHILQSGEQCDDGNADDGDGCSATCLEEKRGGGCSLIR